MLDSETIERNPNLTGEYNVPRAITTFNKRIEPLLVVFKDEVRNTLLISEPEERQIYTTTQCELVNGLPFSEEDQDSLDEVMSISENELLYWGKRGLDPNYMYELAEENWQSKLLSVF